LWVASRLTRAALEHLGLPVFNTVAEAVAKTGANASGIFVPPIFAADAILEAADAGLDLVCMHHRRHPRAGYAMVKRELKDSKTVVVGPNCPGVLSPGYGKIGIMPGYICKKGKIGVVSRSGTLSYEAAVQTSTAGLGQSTIIGIGGDPVNGTNFVQALELLFR
jgi:succinyl-CoA synthetase alpha subunit